MKDAAELIVYKASAGSGKTFTLAVEYIKRLIDNPRAYRNILAVTFTNKATAEMKERILSQLLGIGLNDPDSDAYLQVLCQATGKEEDEVREKTREALNYILHDYSMFRVETIDSFFQSVMRNLARELELNANLNIELDSEEALSQAVDAMFEKLTAGSPVLAWILNFIAEKVGADKSWDISKEIKKFGMNIFKEEFIEKGKDLRASLQQKDFLYNYRNTLLELKNAIAEEMKEFHDRFFRILEENNLEEGDFKSGKYLGGYFRKMAESRLSDKDKGQTVNNCLANSENWVRITSKRREELLALVDSTLMGLLEDCEKQRITNNRIQNSCNLSLRYINSLQLLNNIREEMQLQNQEQNRFLLSDTNALLHELLREGDPSFVFEKIGTQISHVMIDEFQDTSSMQWSNFKLLLLEGLAQGKSSLIVGDVKQSIYRWRGGDWNILNNLSGHLDSFPVKIKDLLTNRRSAPFIIQFNNQFFNYACKKLNNVYSLVSRDLDKAYEKVAQEWLEPKDSREPLGYVQVDFLESPDTKSYEELTAETVANRVKMLLDSGADEKDIAILVRKKKSLEILADYFARETDITLVSDEAFRLDASPAVCLLIYALRVLDNPDNIIALANLAVAFERMRPDNRLSIQDLIGRKEDIASNLPAEFTEHRETLRNMPLYELLEKLYSIFFDNRDNPTGKKAVQQEDAYLLMFFDMVQLYMQTNATDLTSFLQYWDEKLYKQTIPAGEAKGIRILTIHKAKGLEYPNVILPFCDWKMTGEQPELVWCSPSQAPFNELNLVPITWGESMKESVYNENYQNELLQLLVDNLNILYVAFTRPRHNLFVLTKQQNTKKEKEKDKESTEGKGNIGYLLYASLMQEYEAQLNRPDYPTQIHWDGNGTFAYGQFAVKQTRKATEEALPAPAPEKMLQTIPQSRQENELQTTPQRRQDGPNTGHKSSPENVLKTIPQSRPENELQTIPQSRQDGPDTGHKSSPENVLKTIPQSRPAIMLSTDINLEFRQSNQSARFIAGEETEQDRFISNGMLLHTIFSQIRVRQDVKRVVEEMKGNGVISTQHEADDLEAFVNKALSNPRVADWFSGQYKLFNECEILVMKNGTAVSRRPDRVMTSPTETLVVDFKFGVRKPSYIKQVKEYVDLIKRMGYPNVQGFLWYVFEDDGIVPVV